MLKCIQTDIYGYMSVQICGLKGNDKMRKTKIICTVGPATDDENIMRSMMQKGMNVARFNFSHGDYETHEMRFNEVVKIREAFLQKQRKTKD